MPAKKKTTKEQKLTDRQERFCLEYVVDLNAAQAAIRSGYSPNGAAVNASKLLTNHNIKKKIAQLQAEIAKRTEITADMVVRELAAIGFADVRECFDQHGNIMNPKKLPDSIARVVAGIDLIEVKKDVKVKKLKLWNKVAALESLAKHLGMYQQDAGATAININVIDAKQGAADASDQPDN